MEWGPDGHLWLIDPANNRITKVDTTGVSRGKRSDDRWDHRDAVAGRI